jgi:hypothetical protein
VGATRIAFARATARAGVLASIAAVVLLLSGFGTGIVDALAGALDDGLRDGLVAATGTDGAVRWQVRVARDPEAQAEAAASVLDRMLVPHARALEPVRGDRTGRRPARRCPRSVPSCWPTTTRPAGRSS